MALPSIGFRGVYFHKKILIILSIKYSYILKLKCIHCIHLECCVLWMRGNKPHVNPWSSTILQVWLITIHLTIYLNATLESGNIFCESAEWLSLQLFSHAFAVCAFVLVYGLCVLILSFLWVGQMVVSLMGRHGGAVGSIAASHLQGTWFGPELRLLSVLSLACSPRMDFSLGSAQVAK